MKYLFLIPLVILLSQCKEAATPYVNDHASAEILPVEKLLTNESTATSIAVTSPCESLGIQYNDLIKRISSDKKNKQLITELVAWTKNPSHLRCLENDHAYNLLVEQLHDLL